MPPRRISLALLWSIIALTFHLLSVNAQTAGTPKVEFEKYTLSNGLQVILQPDPNTDVVAFHTLVAGGRAAESADQAGITNLTQQLLLRGTTGRTEEQLFGALEDLGAKVGGSALPDAGDISLVATRETWQDALPIYLDVLRGRRAGWVRTRRSHER